MRSAGATAAAAILVVLMAGASCVPVPPAAAHHGKDFLLVESCELPRPREVYLFSSQTWLRARGETATEIEPAVLFGAARAVALEAHAHLNDEGTDGFAYRATAFAARAQLLPPDGAFPCGLGLAAEYEIARRQGHEDVEGNRVESRLIVEEGPEKSRVAVNLIVARPQGAAATMGYAGGWRRQVTEVLTLGIEAQGDLANAASHQAMIGVYCEPTTRFIAKIGVGRGIGPGSPDFGLWTGLVWRP